jgi:hypothetical protein
MSHPDEIHEFLLVTVFIIGAVSGGWEGIFPRYLETD